MDQRIIEILEDKTLSYTEQYYEMQGLGYTFKQIYEIWVKFDEKGKDKCI